MKVATFFDALKGEVPESTILEIANFVEKVEDELCRQISSPVHTVTQVGELTRIGGGKRLRPMLVYMSAVSLGNTFDLQRAVKIGVAMELIHMATLIHDDVIDDAATRRGKPTAFSVHGNTASILGGDVLLAKAMALLAQDGDLQIIRLTSQAVVELAEGEVKELEFRGIFNLSQKDHFEVLRMKTASFIESCCRAGAIIAGAPKSVEDQLGKYGHHIGMAFQLADDILDYRGTPSETGKPIATDFRDGQATLPLIMLACQLTDEEREYTNHKFGNGVTEDDLKMIIGWMEQRGSFHHANKVAESEIDQATQALDVLKDSPAKSILNHVASYVISRKS